MAVFRIEKTRDYTVMSNHHLKDRTLTLKSKGLLSMMLSLPDEWNYTTRGLAAICREGVDSIGAALKELETHGYIRRTQLRDEKGKITDTEYVIYEMPQCEPPSSPGTPLPGTAKPYTENPDMGIPDTAEPCTENPAQLNTNQTKTDLSSTEISNPIPSNPPTPAGARMGMDRMGARECYREVILDNIEYSYLVQDSHIDREQLDEIVDLIVDTECVGTEQKAAEPTEPENPEPEKKSNAGAILAVLLILAAGGGAAVYFLVLKPKQGKKVPADLDDFDLEDEEEYLTEDEVQ